MYEFHPRTPIADGACVDPSCRVPSRLPQGLLMVRRQRVRFVARVPRAPLGCVHTWGVARARHARVSLRNGPFRTIPDSLRSPQGFEMRVAITVSRSSPRQHASVRPDTRGKHTACAVAPSLPDTLADCARPRARPHHRFSTVENRLRRPTTPTCVQASV
jgi:hypothetical protein